MKCIKDSIISFEQAKIIDKYKDTDIQFDTDYLYAITDCYDDSDYPHMYKAGSLIFNHIGRFAKKEVINAPTIDMVLTWLRETKSIYINCFPSVYMIDGKAMHNNKWFVRVMDLHGQYDMRKVFDMFNEITFSSYEGAMSRGIDVALQMIANVNSNILKEKIKNSEWISVKDMLPTDEYDWVLVQFVEKESGFVGLPHIAELRINSDGNKYWHIAEDNPNTEEYLNNNCYASSWKIIECSPEWLLNNKNN